MDLSAITVIAVMTALFFGAIFWMAVLSRKNDPEKTAARKTPGERKTRVNTCLK